MFEVTHDAERPHIANHFDSSGPDATRVGWQLEHADDVDDTMSGRQQTITCNNNGLLSSHVWTPQLHATTSAVGQQAITASWVWCAEKLWHTRHDHAPSAELEHQQDAQHKHNR